MTLSATVAANIRNIRVRNRISQTVVAERAHISVSYVSMLESGERTPPLETLEAIGEALEVSPLRLLEPTDEGRCRADLRWIAARR